MFKALALGLSAGVNIALAAGGGALVGALALKGVQVMSGKKFVVERESAELPRRPQ